MISFTMKKEIWYSVFAKGLFPFIFLLFTGNLYGQKKLTPFEDRNKKWGYKDDKGVIAIPAKYGFAGEFYDGDRAVISLNKKWGLIDPNGQEIVTPQYDSAGSSISGYKNGLLEVKLNGKWGYIDKQGKVVIPIKYQDAKWFQQGLAAVKLNNMWGFIDVNGRAFIDFKYQNASTFQDSVSIVELNNKWGMIFRNGKELIPIKYEELDKTGNIFWDGWLRAKLNNKWGFIYFDGLVLIPFKYDELKKYIMKFDESEDDTADLLSVGDFYYEYEMVKVNGKWGTIDLDGKEMIPIKYQDIWNETDIGLISKGWFRVKLNNKWGLVDAFGNELIALQYTKPFFKIDSNAVKKVAASYTKAIPKNNSGPSSAPQSTQQQTKIITPPLAMKGIIDPAIVGTWKYHDLAVNFNGFYIFRADGTYDYYADMITPTPPSPSYKNFWRVDGEDMEFIIDGKNEVIKQKVFRRNDPQTKQPALVMLWNAQTGEYRTYFPTQPHDLWPQSSIAQTTNGAFSPAAPTVKPVEPPVHLNGVVDATIAGLWKGTLNNIDYYLDIKPDGTYITYSSSDPKRIKSYWRINGNYLEMFSDGMKQVSKFLFAKVNDLQKGKATITFDGFAYFPETPREMWR